MKEDKLSQKILILVPGVFLIAGVGMLIGGIFLLMSTLRFKETAIEISGEITRIDSTYDNDGDEHCSVFVSYEYSGERYENVRLNSYSSSMYEGKKISLYCDPENPRHIQAGSMLYFAPIFLLAMGTVFALVGGGILIPTITAISNRKKIREQGISIYATVEEIAYDTSITVNGRHPFALYCIYRDDYKDVTYRFKSGKLWIDPSTVFPVGSMIEVKVDANDYSKYYVNAEEVEKKIIDYT